MTPTGKVGTANEADPLTSEAVPSTVPPPYVKVTVPVGVPLPGATALTVTLSVSACP